LKKYDDLKFWFNRKYFKTFLSVTLLQIGYRKLYKNSSAVLHTLLPVARHNTD
jgi:hypothetical protein